MLGERQAPVADPVPAASADGNGKTQTFAGVAANEGQDQKAEGSSVPVTWLVLIAAVAAVLLKVASDKRKQSTAGSNKS